MRRSLSLLGAYTRIGVTLQIAYPLAYWMELLNILIKVFALSAVWSALFVADADAFPVGYREMITYAVVTAVGRELLNWWRGAHFDIAERVRLGTITGELLRPVSFPFQLFGLNAGRAVSTVVVTIAPALAVSTVLYPLTPPASLLHGAAFVVSVLLAFGILHCCNFLVGLVVFKSLTLRGIQHAYHGLITFFSGVWIPLWFYPEWLRTVLDWLPFKLLFFVPATIYIGDVETEELIAELAKAGLYLLAIAALVVLGWRRARSWVEVQGG